MKNIVKVLLFTFCLQLSFGQSSDISGFCDVLTITTNQNSQMDWDTCESFTYEGIVEIESVDGRLYNVYTTNDEEDQFNDLSFGAYYGCYEASHQNNFPNFSKYSPSLFLAIKSDGTLYFSGRSQWDDIYFLNDMTMAGTELIFSWTNDYGEGATVKLTRQDEQNWMDLIVPCPLNETDSLALVALYNSTDGPNWKIKWDLESPITSWYGVIISPISCRITQIDLGPDRDAFDSCLIDCGNNLVGFIPDEITDLEGLTTLDLRGNHLTGDIPDGIANLSKLRILDLSLNNLTGIFPEEITSLDNLTYIDLVLNNLTGIIPEEIDNLSLLERLNLGGNDLTGTIPNQLGNLGNLRYLSLEHNNLTGEIPSSLSELTFLTHLYLSYNQLSGTIASGYGSIQRVRFNNNLFSGHFPESFSVPDRVWEINLSNNNFTGPIPSRFFEAGFILGTDRLFFQNNDFSGCVELIDDLCTNDFVQDIDSTFYAESDNSFFDDIGYNLTGNPKLAWEGDLQNACNGEDQISAPCDDGDPNTLDDIINDDCECIGKPVSTKDIKELNSISVSPNPSFSGDIINVHIDLNDNINAKLTILDGLGKVILAKLLGTINGINSLSLNTQNLKSGLYFIQLETSHGVFSRKVVVH